MSKICHVCGKELDDSARFCDGCGTSFADAQPDQSSQTNYSPPPNQGYAQQTGGAAGAEEVFSPEDIEKNKTMAGLAYIIFFLPLVACPESRFARFHANQALLVLLLAIAATIVNVIPILGCIIAVIVWIFAGVLGIMGLINGFTGKAKRLPIIGKINIIK